MCTCSLLAGHCIGAKEVTIYWYVGALCWTETINTSRQRGGEREREREQGSSSVKVKKKRKKKDWH